LGNAPAYNTVTSRTQLGDLTASGGLTTLKQSADGCIYAMNGGYTTNGLIYKVCPLGVGIEEKNAINTSMIVFPNPAKNYVTVELNSAEEKNIQLQLTDVCGKIVITENTVAKKGKTAINIDLKNSMEGIYFIQLKDLGTKQLLSTKKIVVE
jgi:hypothetical protein